MAGRRVLITGVASHLGTALARRLQRERDFDYVAGLDTRAPRVRLDRVDHIEVDIRDPLLMKVLPGLRVDTLVHNQIVRQPGPGMSPQAAHDINVIGSLQLLAACEKASTINTIVVRGSAGIYGAEPAAPQYFTEELARLYPLRTRFQRDVSEIEDYFGTYSRRYPAATCTMLRYQPAIGPSLHTQVTRYLGQPVLPTYLGYDPRLQFIHEHDAVEALVASVKRPVKGPVNVAAEGTIGLTRMVRLTGKPSVPMPPPLFGPAVEAGKRLGLTAFSPDFRRLLRYGRAVDISRLVEEVGFRPRFSAAGAVEEYLRSVRANGVAAGRRSSRPLAATP